MKTQMFKITIITIALAALTGCVSPDKVIAAAAKDPAAAVVRINCVYGSVEILRAMPTGSNSITVGGSSGITTR